MFKRLLSTTHTADVFHVTTIMSFMRPYGPITLPPYGDRGSISLLEYMWRESPQASNLLSRRGNRKPEFDQYVVPRALIAHRLLRLEHPRIFTVADAIFPDDDSIKALFDSFSTREGQEKFVMHAEKACGAWHRVHSIAADNQILVSIRNFITDDMLPLAMPSPRLTFSDNNGASKIKPALETEIIFPGPDATKEQIRAFEIKHSPAFRRR